MKRTFSLIAAAFAALVAGSVGGGPKVPLRDVAARVLEGHPDVDPFLVIAFVAWDILNNIPKVYIFHKPAPASRWAGSMQ